MLVTKSKREQRKKRRGKKEKKEKEKKKSGENWGKKDCDSRWLGHRISSLLN